MEIFTIIAQLGGLVVLAGALLTGMVFTKAAVEAILKERDKADTLRDQRLEDQKAVNKELTDALKSNAEALRRLADAWEARNRADAERRRAGDVQQI